MYIPDKYSSSFVIVSLQFMHFIYSTYFNSVMKLVEDITDCRTVSLRLFIYYVHVVFVQEQQSFVFGNL